MRASVLVDVGRMEVRDIPEPEVRPHDVLVAPQAVGLCGTDFHIHGGEMNFNCDERGAPIPLAETPQVLGHEIAGTVLEVGPEVRDLAAGDRVVLDQGINCTSARREVACEYCATGDSHQCAHYVEHGITGLQGGLAERLALPAVNAVRIESDLDLVSAALTEPIGCILHSADFATRMPARYRIGASDGAHRVRTALVTGAGPAGLIWIQVLRHVLGFDGPILCAELDASKRALAEGLGAIPLDPKADLVEEVREATGGRMVEYLVEATGAGPIFGVLPQLMRKQATFVMYGVGHGGASLELMNQVQWKEPSLVVSVGASGGFDADGRPTVYRRALGLIEEGSIDVSGLITHRYDGLDAVPEAFAGQHGAPGYVKGIAVLG